MKDKIAFILVFLLAVSITYGFGSMVIAGFEYEAEKMNTSESMLKNISEIKDGFIHDSIEEEVTNITRNHFDRMDKLFDRERINKSNNG